MIENISMPLEVFSLKRAEDTRPVIDALLGGKIILLRLGSVYSFVLNPRICGLVQSFNFLKERQSEQLLSIVSNYEDAKRLVDPSRVNEDFFRLPPEFCSKVIVRIPLNNNLPQGIPYDKSTNSLQFIDFGKTNIIRKALVDGLTTGGCEFLSITSGNLHGAPTIENLDAAKRLATLLNIKASFFDLDEVRTAVADIPEDRGAHKGSFAILSFCNPAAIEVKRLANKNDRNVTEKHLGELFSQFEAKTPLIFSL